MLIQPRLTFMDVETHWNELLRFPVVYLWFYGCYRHYQYLGMGEKKDAASPLQ